MRVFHALFLKKILMAVAGREGTLTDWPRASHGFGVFAACVRRFAAFFHGIFVRVVFSALCLRTLCFFFGFAFLCEDLL